MASRTCPPRMTCRSSLATRATPVVSAVQAYLAAQMRREVGNAVHRPSGPSARSLVSPAQPVASGPHTGSDEASPRRVPALLAH